MLGAAVIGMDVTHADPELGGDLTLGRRLAPELETEDAHRPTAGIGERLEREGLRAGEVGDQRRSDRTPPVGGLLQQRADLPAVLRSESLDRVDRAEHLGQVGADRVEVERRCRRPRRRPDDGG